METASTEKKQNGYWEDINTNYFTHQNGQEIGVLVALEHNAELQPDSV